MQTTLELLQTDPEFLQFVAEHGNMSPEDSRHEYEMQKNEKYLKMHNRKIWQGKDGDWYTRTEDPDGKIRLRHATTRKALDQLIINHYRTVEELPTISRVFSEWIDERIQYEEVELGTIDKARSDFNRFIKGTDLEFRQIATVNEDTLTPFIKASIHDNNLTAKAWAGLKGLLFGIFAYARDHKYTEFSISSYFGDLRLPKTIFRKKVTLDEEQVFTDEEIRKIASWITETEERLSSLSNLGILLDFYTGLRAGELSTLKFSDFNGSLLSVHRTETRHKSPDNKSYEYVVREYTKGKAGARIIAVPDEALRIVELIRKINPTGEFLFMYDDHRLISDAFSKKLFRICQYVGIPKRSMHKIRKTYATILWDAGMLTEKAIITQMGHVDSQVTRDHYYYNRSSQNGNVEKINSIFSQMVTPVTV